MDGFKIKRKMNEVLTQAKKNYKNIRNILTGLKVSWPTKTKEKSSDFSFLYVSYWLWYSDKLKQWHFARDIKKLGWWSAIHMKSYSVLYSPWHKHHSGLLHHTWMSKMPHERFRLPETGCYNFSPCHKFTYTSYWTLVQPHLVSFNHITSLPAIRIDPDLKETRSAMEN